MQVPLDGVLLGHVAAGDERRLIRDDKHEDKISSWSSHVLVLGSRCLQVEYIGN